MLCKKGVEWNLRTRCCRRSRRFLCLQADVVLLLIINYVQIYIKSEVFME